ncbi:MAG: zinc ribbon domain-containing protein [Deltaproteobacteria bacterium]|nr:zinc ribbon domain-containing protein [Deltaproteobacteria bacterium]
MPIYEYECAGCGRVVEQWQKFSDEPLTACPHCTGSLSKLISNCAFHLKGGGWYVKEYGSGSCGGKTENKADGDAATPAGASESSGTEAAKPAPIT